MRQGDFITIIGSNGAGKSTLLNVIAGVYEVEEGEIWDNGDNVTGQPEHRRAHFIGRVFQDPMIGTAASMTIEENLAMAMKRPNRLGLAPGVSVEIGPGFGSCWPSSPGAGGPAAGAGGLAVWRTEAALTLLMATISNPKLLFLDEHTAALDPKTGEMIGEFDCRIIKNRELTALMVTHDLRQALEFGNRTIMMDQGQIILDLKIPTEHR